MPRTAVFLPLALGVACLAANKAEAFPDFQKVFVEEYAGEGADEAYAELVKDAKCYVCHYGKSKKNRNPYGEALHEYIGKKDRKDVKKITEALEKVAEMPFDAEDEDSPTFGDRIQDGKLPGGELEELKKDKKD